MERQQHEQAPRDPLSLLRSVESTPPGDLDWALHCTRQQAMILNLLLGGREAMSLARLSAITEIQIGLVEDMPIPGTAFPAADGWHIHIHAALPSEQQLRTALHELKHVIDHPVRTRADGPCLSPVEYEHLADAFAELMLGDDRLQSDNNFTERRDYL